MHRHDGADYKVATCNDTRGLEDDRHLGTLGNTYPEESSVIINIRTCIIGGEGFFWLIDGDIPISHSFLLFLLLASCKNTKYFNPRITPLVGVLSCVLRILQRIRAPVLVANELGNLSVVVRSMRWTWLRFAGRRLCLGGLRRR